MAAFEYDALDSGGRTRRGLLEGESERQVRRQLRDKGLVPVKLREVQRRGASRSSPLRGGGRLNTEQVALMTRLLATLLQSGLPVDDALNALAQQADTPALKKVALGIRSKVLEGHTLEVALNQFPRTFPEEYRATVGAGEQTRHLPLVLSRLADYTEQRQALQQQIQVAMIYPAVLTTVAVLVVAGLLTYVVPQVVQVFENMNQELPRLTVWLIASSDFAKSSGAYVLVAFVVVIVGLRRLLRVERYRKAFDAAVLKTPVLGKLTRESNASRMVRTLSILLQSGVETLDALAIAAKSISSRPMRDALQSTAARVREGEPLHKPLGESKLFPPLTIHLIANGEASGELTKMLDTAAEAHEREIKSSLALLLGLVEPLLILVMGGIVLAIVVAILLPIFEVNQLV